MTTRLLHRLPLLALAVAVAITALWAPRARAQVFGLDPLVRLHAGVTGVLPPTPVAVTLGMDARCTRLLVVDVGAFANPFHLAEDLPAPATPAETFHVRHGIYVAPGLVIPHRQPAAFSWDVTVRAGMNALFLANLDPEAPVLGDSTYQHVAVPAGSLGLELLLRKGPVGARLGYRQLAYAPFHADEAHYLFQTSGQATLEAVWQVESKR